MEKERRKFSREFKLNAVDLSYSRANIRQLAHELDVRPELIYRWRSEFENYKGTSFPGNGKAKLTEEESELFRLKKDLAEARMERDILKKAVHIFSKSGGRFTNS